MNQTESIRVNVMARDDQTLKISIVLLSTTPSTQSQPR